MRTVIVAQTVQLACLKMVKVATRFQRLRTRRAFVQWRARVALMKQISELKSGFKPRVTSLMQEQVKQSKVVATKREQLAKLLANLKELKTKTPQAN